VIVLLAAVIIFVVYLVGERAAVNRRVRSIPLRICVTGTRGKSSVVRMLASVLREDGRKALAKSTGSQARIVLPDGEEIDVPRRGMPSIIEQKKFLKMAADAHADGIVAEIMSIHPENHLIESHRILKPNIVVITNVRRDHTDAMGDTEEEIAGVFCLDIPAKARVFIPEKEQRPQFRAAVAAAEGELITVREGAASPLYRLAPELKRNEFSANVDLVYALGTYLGIDRGTVLDGIRKSKADIGAFKVWRYRPPSVRKTLYLVNGFAANDPVSTGEIVSRVKDMLPSAAAACTGLLNLRPDRGDRTAQWAAALTGGASGWFTRIFVTGAHAHAVKRKVRQAEIIKQKQPEKIMEIIAAASGDQAVIVGFGNMGGTGRLLVEYWNTIGTEYGL